MRDLHAYMRTKRRGDRREGGRGGITGEGEEKSVDSIVGMPCTSCGQTVVTDYYSTLYQDHPHHHLPKVYS